MLCDECKKRNAVVHMSKIVQGKKEELHLCEVCARNKDVSIEKNFTIPNFLANLLDAGMGSGIVKGYDEVLKCNHCGSTFREFKQNGRLGCDECYQIYKEKLKPLVRRIHGNTKHIGKVPKRCGGIIHLRKQLQELKQKLQKAIDQEAFEEAAVLRDEIHRIEEEIRK
ncbi:UvrB/UvrC motif-containing protein [Alkaliphilus serpentinus]|uniref:UVR domain-containing protein n=1 Tax=Alkaliphilus serpentinus TaxID=1482731 RepID=A0A833HQW4_9FIRM|nr:UvrB/UvrC motif-containing protein [Alkaliphilus serpentinus]KAB3532411.1 hypothetical protein F8153_02570 [Alkaliphilus serpentinus]